MDKKELRKLRYDYAVTLRYAKCKACENLALCDASHL